MGTGLRGQVLRPWSSRVRRPHLEIIRLALPRLASSWAPHFLGGPQTRWPTGTREVPAPDVTCPLQSGFPWFPGQLWGSSCFAPQPRTWASLLEVPQGQLARPRLGQRPVP